MLDFDPKILIVQIVTFLLGMILIWKVFIKMFLGMIEKRAAEVKTALENAEKNKADTEEMKAEYLKHLEEIEKRVQEAIKDATKEGIEVKNEIILKARQEAKNILDKTYEKIGIEKDKMLKELRTEVVNMSISIAEKVIKENITKKVDDKLVDEVLSEIEKGGG
ncbi:MAG: F0F1 ATP synthase subunit B [Candidatus Firestonebacteria bacterium]